MSSESETAIDESLVGDEEGESCAICYEDFFTDVEIDDPSLPTSKECLFVQGCQHRFCRECLKNHCKHSISTRDIPIKCPASASDKCENTLAEDQIKDILLRSPQHSHDESSSADWIRFQRFQQIAENPSLISCCRCQEVVSLDENKTQGGFDNQLTCPSCEHSFCSVHGDGHPEMSCEEYKKKKPAKEMKKSERIIQRMTKPCSHCSVPIQKESGCDHIICPHCDDDMCYRCGTHIHLTGEMIRSCKNCEQNFVDHRYIWSYRFAVCLSLPFYIPFCIIYIVVMGAVALATFGCCCCLFCGADTDPDGETSYSPMRGVVKVLALVFLPAFDLFRECGLNCGIRIYQKYAGDFPLMPSPLLVEQGNDSDHDSDDDEKENEHAANNV